MRSTLSVNLILARGNKMNEFIHDWNTDKFGMFIHYGIWSSPGGVWKGKRVTRGYSEMILPCQEPDNPISDEEYAALSHEFTAENFKADEIASLAKSAGMSFIVLVSKHHDGFCLFKTKTTKYNSVDTAAGRDLVKEMAEACERVGLKFGLYWSWIDWHAPAALTYSDHNSDPITDDHQKMNLAQVEELLTQYGPICQLWFDMGAPTFRQSKEMADLVRRVQPETMINGRIWNGHEDFLVLADNEIPDFKMDVPWQTPATLFPNTWGYRSWQERCELNIKIKEKIRDLAKITARGGQYLLNIGPKGDGCLVEYESDVMKGIGTWLETFGDAIYHTKANPWKEAETYACSLSSNAVNVFLFDLPSNETVELLGIKTVPDTVYSMKTGKKFEFSLTDEGLRIFGVNYLDDDNLPTIRVQFSRSPSIVQNPTRIKRNDKLPEATYTRYYHGRDYYTYTHYINKMEWTLIKSWGDTATVSWYTEEPLKEDIELVFTSGFGKYTVLKATKGERRGVVSEIDDWRIDQVKELSISLASGDGIPEDLALYID